MSYILTGDCLAVMPTLEAESVDAIVSDPPYGLAFMGKAWDHGVPGPEFWREALRVAKPGAHLVAFGGTRTYHRLTCAIEDAGWEIRDCLSWLYGSGFPKSLDVSKAMDKMDAAEEQMQRRYRFTKWVVSRGVTAKQINAVLDVSDMGRHYTDVLPNGKQPAIMTREHLEACRHLFGGADIPEWVERECDIRSVESRTFAEREVVGRSGNGQGRGWAEAGLAGYKAEFAITAPATDLARAWQGWGTALKPGWEPIILARKPLRGTVASNVAQYGTGAVNVDGCRIPIDPIADASQLRTMTRNQRITADGWGLSTVTGDTPQVVREEGRWPANVVLDEEAAGMLDVQTGDIKTQRIEKPRDCAEDGQWGTMQGRRGARGYSGTGGASRFFYTAKASRREREAGLEGMPEREYQVAVIQTQGIGLHGESLNGKQVARSRNHHPTVKPIALMRWLCRLVTPKGGLILDPFTGSGSTGCAAVLEGFRFVGIEREPEYAAIAEKRIAHWAGQVNVPDEQVSFL